MRAVVHQGRADFEGLSYRADFPDPAPGPGEVRVALKSAGLNHRDLFIVQKRHQAEDPALVIGSDGAGIVSGVGENVTSVHVGDEVVIIPSLRWQKKSPAPPDDFDILGFPDNGTLAESIVVSEKQVAAKPGYLTWEEAGVLPLSALTGYRALFTRGGLKPGDTVFIPGIGSGVATYMLQMAKAVGARVIVSSRSSEKLDRAKTMGADIVLNNEQNWTEAVGDITVDLVIESVGAATFNRSLALLKPGGTIVTFGASAGDEVSIDLRQFFYKQWNLHGTTMGSIEEFYEMLNLFNKFQIHPVVDRSFELKDAGEALKRLMTGSQFGKIAILIG
ncbi:zinc-binding dehydrogenase [Sporolactobacillus putidus]|uniref:Zinc-type alcohol dehydrogenase-like protein YogA n=1 Tax=Sporolactobacillus putidus TaxID=492735 RepID=A0A917S8U5_9BACL|nr:zinc-binding dehydrogenase [Sporolactobacillus putidus]GGL64846.1 putative zinc-type alcohol dehydrogenase-like protein YogA [Sporolactobacillus putidus]